MQSCFGLTSESEDLFTLQMDSSDTQSRITLEPINGEKVVFSEAVTVFDHNSKESLSANKFFPCKLPLFSVQLRAVFE